MTFKSGKVIQTKPERTIFRILDHHFLDELFQVNGVLYYNGCSDQDIA